MKITRRTILQTAGAAAMSVGVGCSDDSTAGDPNSPGADGGSDGSAPDGTGGSATDGSGTDGGSDGADGDGSADAQLGVLVWQDDVSVSADTFTWTEAVAYAAALNLDGHTDWRLPTEAELATIEGEHNGFVTEIHNTDVHWYWTADEVDSNMAIVRYHEITAGIIDDKNNLYFVRCVRNT